MNNKFMAMLSVPVVAFAFIGGIGGLTLPASATIDCIAELEGGGSSIGKDDYKEQKEFEKEKLARGEVTKDEAKAEIDACKELYKNSK